MAPMIHTFAVYPTALDDSFDSFLMDVPTLSDQDAAARRAWWQAFHLLGKQEIEPEQFTVCEWITADGGPGMPGRLVTSGGLTGLVHVPDGSSYRGRYADGDRAGGRNTMTRNADADLCTPGGAVA